MLAGPDFETGFEPDFVASHPDIVSTTCDSVVVDPLNNGRQSWKSGWPDLNTGRSVVAGRETGSELDSGQSGCGTGLGVDSQEVEWEVEQEAEKAAVVPGHTQVDREWDRKPPAGLERNQDSAQNFD